MPLQTVPGTYSVLNKYFNKHAKKLKIRKGKNTKTRQTQQKLTTKIKEKGKKTKLE